MKLILLLLFIPLLNSSKIITKESHTDLPFVNKKWKLEELRFLQNNIPHYYKRGDVASALDNDYFIFYESGKGMYHQGDGIEFSLNWKQNEQKDLIFTIEKFMFNSDLVISWENIKYTDETISYTEYYTHANGIHSLAHGIRFSNCQEQYVHK